MRSRDVPPLRSATLWAQSGDLDPQVFAYTVGDDRIWDVRLLRWDVLGSLGHAEGLRASGILSAAEYRRIRAGLRAALRAVALGELKIGVEHEDVHTAVEHWLTLRHSDSGKRLHTGRSRNDQVTCDLRLYLKDRALSLHLSALELSFAFVDFAARHRSVLWPGYTHQRRAMPSSAGLWAAGYAEGLLDTIESLPALWARLDRSPLGSAAGYGVPLPLQREAAAKALGFKGLDQIVTSVQNGRGKLEAAVLFWCSQLGHDLGRLATDVILYTAEEFGFLVLPVELATGSSIMPHKRNPDLFELTRARAAALDGDLAAVMHIKGKLGGGYHRDFQYLKEPLFRGLDRAAEMLAMMTVAVPRLDVDRERSRVALAGAPLATDEVMRRVEQGAAFRAAYCDVSAALARGESFPEPSMAELVARRRSTGNLGNLMLGNLRQRLGDAKRWGERERRRFDRVMRRLAGSPARSERSAKASKAARAARRPR